MNFNSAILPAALAAGLLASPALAVPYSLTFDGDICSSGNGPLGPCTDASGIDQSYGDVPGVVDVLYGNRNDPSVIGDNVLGQLAFWGPDYGDLTNVAYGVQSNAVAIILRPLNGLLMTLISFDLAGFLSDYESQVTIEDGNGNVLTSTGAITVPGVGRQTFSNPGNWSSLDEIRIIWGPDGYNVGIDNINFTVTAALPPIDPNDPTTPAIPLPAAGWMMIAGIGALAALRRRRKA
ncbi:MAG: VPLPA-CTERM sorting domain-containing protein [Gemmobacter sp.]